MFQAFEMRGTDMGTIRGYNSKVDASMLSVLRTAAQRWCFFTFHHFCIFAFFFFIIILCHHSSDCGLSTHKQCSKIMPKDCTPSMRLLKRIYGIDLTTLVKAQNTMRPVVIDKCIEELETRGKIRLNVIPLVQEAS